MSPGAESSSLMTGTLPVFETQVAETSSAADERALVFRVREALVSEKLNRAVNFSIALISLVVLTPLMLLIAVAVKLTSRGPIVYRQTRVGVDRRRTGGDRRGAGERRTPKGRASESRGRMDPLVGSAPAMERRASPGPAHDCSWCVTIRHHG